MASSLSFASLYNSSSCNDDGNDDKLTPLLIIQHDGAERTDIDQCGVAGAPRKLKQASLLLSLLLGCCVQLIASFTTTTMSSHRLIVFLGILVTLWQAWFMTMPLASIVNMDFAIWCTIAILSFQSGLFLAWVISDYNHHINANSNHQPRVSYYYTIVEIVSLSKFLLFTWLMVLELHTEAAVETKSTPSSSEEEHHQTPSEPSSSHTAAKESSDKLKLGSLFLAYSLGYGAKLAGTMMRSSTWARIFLVGGTLLTILQSYITSRFFPWSMDSLSAYVGAVNMVLWTCASVSSYQAGFYCAWSLKDFMLGEPQQMLVHVVLEAICIAVSMISTWVVSCDPPDEEEASHKGYVAMHETE